jgi:hypothetical protein
MSSAPILKHYPPVNTTFDPPKFSLDNTFKGTVSTGKICLKMVWLNKST